MKNKIILLVEDNPEDIKLTRRACSKSKIANELVVVNDGARPAGVCASPLSA